MRSLNRILPIIIALSSVVIYLYTAAPFMLWLDSSRLLAAIITLGIAYPAEPVYVFLAHWFTYLPFGSVVFRVQVFSVFLAGSSLLLLYRLVIRILNKLIEPQKKNRALLMRPSLMFAGVFGMLVLAFSYQFWSQAQNVETFIFDCFIELVILSLLLADISPKNVFTILAVVVSIGGIATGTDPPVAGAIYPSVLLVIWRWKAILGKKRLISLCLLGLSGVLLAWSYLPIMESRKPLLNAVDGSTIEGIWTVATGRLSDVSSKGFVNGLTLSPPVLLGSAWHFLVMAWMDFTPILLPFIVIGTIYLWRQKRTIFFLLFLVVITNLLAACFYHSETQESWFLQSDVIFAICAALGYVWIVELIVNRVPAFKLRVTQAILLLVAFIPLVYWWSTLDRHSWHLTQDYIDSLYDPIQNPAILLGSGDLWEATTVYVYTATNYKHTVVPVWDRGLYGSIWETVTIASRAHISIPNTSRLTHSSPIEYSKFMNDFFARNIGKYHIYLTQSALKDIIFTNGPSQPSLQIDERRFKLVPVGMLQEIIPVNAHAAFNLKDFSFHFDHGFPKTMPYFLEQNYSNEMQIVAIEIVLSYDSAANYLMYDNRFAEAETLFQKTYALMPDNLVVLADLGDFYTKQNQPAKALEYFMKAHMRQPDDVSLLYDMAIIEGQLGKINEEKHNLQSIMANSEVDSTFKHHVSDLLKNLNQKISNTEGSIQPTIPATQSGWKTFTNTAMNISVSYPDTILLTQISLQTISLTDPSHPNMENRLFIYSGKILRNNPSYLWVPFHLPSQLKESTPVQFPGFQGVMDIYGEQTKLLLLKKEQQLIGVLFPKQLTFAPGVLNRIVQSITTLH